MTNHVPPGHAPSGHANGSEGILPYKVAVLCYLYDHQGRLLLLHRRQEPNREMYSPVGGKLHTHEGEGPHECAAREILEETGVKLRPDELRLTGILSERAYQGESHWLIFLFEATRPIDPGELKWEEFREGKLEWHAVEEVDQLPIPFTDRQVMWPCTKSHRGGFFMVHVDCTTEPVTWNLHESVKAAEI